MYGSPVSARRKDIHINCPFGVYHSKGYDSSQGLSVKIEPNGRSAAYCFSCGASGTVSFVFAEAAKVDPSYADVAAFVQERDGPSLSGSLDRLRAEPGQASEVPSTDWAVYAAQCARQVPRYLVERGIVRADVKRWQLGFDAELQRAIFPVRDHTGHVVGCLRRSVWPDQEPKYKDTPGAYVWKKEVFYGEHLIDTTKDTVYLVEGPMGAIFASRLLPNVLAMMGADTGVEQRRLMNLQRWGIKAVVLMLDSDKKGQQAVFGHRVKQSGKWRVGLRDLLRPHFVVKVAQLPPGEDPDDVVRRDPTALRQVVRSASYLTPSRHLTGESNDATVSPPTVGRSFMGYMMNRRGLRQEDV